MKNQEFQKLQDIVKKLRDPIDGCPWDLKQTHQSLLPYLIEESYEFLNAAEDKNDPSMEEELGDVLLQVLLHTTISEQENRFTLETVAKKLAEKLIRRHPHVFEKKDKTINAEQVTKNWEKIKREEKGKNSISLIENSVLNCPSLTSAYK